MLVQRGFRKVSTDGFHKKFVIDGERLSKEAEAKKIQELVEGLLENPQVPHLFALAGLRRAHGSGGLAQLVHVH